MYPSIRENVSLHDVVKAQGMILHGQDMRDHKHIPKVLGICNQVLDANKRKPQHEELTDYFVELCS